MDGVTDGMVHDVVCACTAAGAGIGDVGYMAARAGMAHAGDDGGGGGYMWAACMAGGGQSFMFPSFADDHVSTLPVTTYHLNVQTSIGVHERLPRKGR